MLTIGASDLDAVLLGDHAVQGSFQVGPGWGNGVLLVQERDGILQSEAVVGQFIRRRGVEGCFGWSTAGVGGVVAVPGM